MLGTRWARDALADIDCKVLASEVESVVSTMISEVYDALLDAGASEEKARRAAETLANYDDRFNRLERKVDGTKSDLERKIEGLSGRVTLLQWQLAVLIGGVAALVIKAFA